MKNSLIVIASFAVIFSFSSIDSSISPMVRELHQYFKVEMDQILLLISWCTFGTVTGVLVGPALIDSFPVSRLLAWSCLGMIAGAIAFLQLGNFSLALAARLIFGLSSGVFASCMWWVTFYGVPKTHFPAMVTVLMSARPLATAIGVPFAGMLAAGYAWQVPFEIFIAGILLGGLGLPWAFWRASEEVKTPLSLKKIAADYQQAFRIPFAFMYYAGFTINRMCYFGFYAFSGIWFITHFQLTLPQISTALFFIGLGEAGMTFLVPGLLKMFGHNRMFTGSLILSGLVFPLFIRGGLPYRPTVGLIALFMLLDRVYCMALVVSIPRMFPEAGNKTVFGSLNTLTAWAGLTTIAWIGARFTALIGLAGMEILLITLFWVGSALLYAVQYRTVLYPPMETVSS